MISFEAFSDGDVAVTEEMYDVVPDGSVIFVEDRQSIAYSQRVAQVRFRNLRGATVEDKIATLDEYETDGPVFVLLTESQKAHGIVVGGEDAAFFDELIAGLRASGRFEELARSSEDNVLLELTAP